MPAAALASHRGDDSSLAGCTEDAGCSPASLRTLYSPASLRTLYSPASLRTPRALAWSHEPAPPPPPSTNGRGNGDRRPGDGPGNGPGGRPTKSSGIPKWAIWVFLGLLAGALLIPMLLSKKSGEDITYSQFRSEVQDGNVDSITVNNNTGGISGTLNSGRDVPHHRPDAVARRRPRAAEPEERRRRVQDATEPASSQALIPLLLPVAADHRLLRLDAAPRRRARWATSCRSADRGRRPTPPNGRARPSPTSPATRASSRRSREVVDFLKYARAVRARSAPASPRACCSSGRPGTGKTLHRPGRRRRGRRAVPVGHRLGLHGDVRRRRRQPRARPVPDGPQAGPGHHLRRRDRLDRPQARRRPRRRPRRAGADAQPDARPRWTASRPPRAS